MANVYVGIGSNLGDRQSNIDRALAFLREDEDIEVKATFEPSHPKMGLLVNEAAKLISHRG